MSFAFIAEQSAHYKVARLCNVMHVSRRDYYDWLSRPDLLDLYSRKIVGWSMSHRLTSDLAQ